MINQLSEIPTTKLVTIQLAARTRVEYVEVVEIPANATQENIDGGLYVSDPDYWERATCIAIAENVGSDSNKKATLTPQGGWVVESVL